jgi:L-amino acid N-acyltransferase YncA
VAEDGAQRVVGWSSLSKFRPWPGYRLTGEDSICVAADWRGQGTDASRQASRRLHQYLGVEQVAYRSRPWLDVVHMERLLNQAPPSAGG